MLENIKRGIRFWMTVIIENINKKFKTLKLIKAKNKG
jgi:hypothetical protein